MTFLLLLPYSLAFTPPTIGVRLREAVLRKQPLVHPHESAASTGCTSTKKSLHMPTNGVLHQLEGVRYVRTAVVVLLAAMFHRWAFGLLGGVLAAFFDHQRVLIHAHRRPAVWRLSAEERLQFERDGVLLVKGLLRGSQLAKAQRSARQTVRSHWLISRLNKLAQWDSLSLQGWRTSQAFADVAFFSAAPSIVSQVFRPRAHAPEAPQPDGTGGGDGEHVRLLKDAMLAFAPGRRGCGWHVDDHALWPTHDDDVGANVWISLSPLTASGGGGLAVVPGSHRSAEARHCRSIIGGEQPLTCSLHSLAPEWHNWMEARSVEYDMAPGDALLLDRFTFHRSSPFKTPQPSGTRALRLSIRYAPAAARLVDNGIEPALRPDQRVERARGATSGDALERFGAWYPQVYPAPRVDECAEVARGRVAADFGWRHHAETTAHLLGAAFQKRWSQSRWSRASPVSASE